MASKNARWQSKMKLDNSSVQYLYTIAVMVVCLIAYGQALHGPLFFDDIPNITENMLLRFDGREFDAWRVAAISSDAGLLQRPLAMLSFALNYVVSGEFSPVALKATNVGVHLSIAALIYVLCRRLLQAPALARTALGDGREVALLAAALWLLHPIHVSTVLYAVQRMAQLSTLFVIAGLLVFTHYRLRWSLKGASTGDVMAAGLWLLLVGLMAVLSKENGILLPWLIVVLEVTLFCGVWNGQAVRWLQRAAWCLLLLPVLLVVAVTLLYPELVAGRYANRDFVLEERLLTQARVLWEYLYWIVFPNITSLGFFHDDIVVSSGLWLPYTTALSLLAWAIVIPLVIGMRKRFPLPAFALLFYLVAHSLESSVIPLELVFEHRNYLPSVGILLFIAACIYQLAEKFNGLRLRVLVGIVLSVLSLQLVLRTSAWTDELTLAQYNATNHPESFRANFFYGNALFERFARAESLALSADEQKMLAVMARNVFAHAHTLNENSFAPVVMLYQLDTLNFPGLARDNDWLSKLESGALTKRLNASDFSALETLTDFSLSDSGAGERERVAHILSSLSDRYAHRQNLAAMQYRFAMSAAGGRSDTAADRVQRRKLLEDAAQRRAANRTLYAYLVQHHGSEDIGVTYEWLRTWMLLDTQRRELPVIRGIFER